MELQADKRFHNLTLEQVQALDKVLTEVIPIQGRGNFPTLLIRAKDIIRVVKDRLVERDIQVKDIRLNGATASHILVRDNGLGYRDLDIIFGVELPRQEDFQVIKEVVLGSLRDLLPCGVNRRKITCLTMKEAYVQKMVKVFNEHDRWSLIALSNNRAKTVGLRFVSSLRRQFEFSVDSFQIILDRMLESYWETERRQEGKLAAKAGNLSSTDKENKIKEQEHSTLSVKVEQNTKTNPAHATSAESRGQVEAFSALEEKETLIDRQYEEAQQVSIKEDNGGDENNTQEDIVFELCEENRDTNYPLAVPPETLHISVSDPSMTQACVELQSSEELDDSPAPQPSLTTHTEHSLPQEVSQLKVASVVRRDKNTPSFQESHLEFTFPPPAKKTCSTSQDIMPDYCKSPKLQRKMSRKLISKPEKWSLLPDLSDLTTQLFPPIEIPKPLLPQPSQQDDALVNGQNSPSIKAEDFDHVGTPTTPTCVTASAAQTEAGSTESVEQPLKMKSKKPPDPEMQTTRCAVASHLQVEHEGPEVQSSSDFWVGAAGEPIITVEAECMYGDFNQAMDHLRERLIATHNPEEIRGGGLLKYSDLLVRNFRPASETEIKSLERYMCSRFFIDFPDVNEQQRKIEAYLQCHFIGNEETSKYDYLMTLRRVIDESTVCLMGHERRQTLNMITVLALRVLGEQNAIPNTTNVTCFYQPAAYMAEPMYNGYFITQAQPPLVYHPYPLHVHMQTGLV
ncbi:uncharacterized protein LOC114476234 [Gouania willdenowi]|uniref:uncharacterized protein LOC114476234 n=1 Tax=Gouania willdenowi TaxID=441366 RepID=UPI001055CC8D|nr:uncharacterized protein LOC114476234 [Gouania willdenowi]